MQGTDEVTKQLIRTPLSHALLGVFISIPLLFLHKLFAHPDCKSAQRDGLAAALQLAAVARAPCGLQLPHLLCAPAPHLASQDVVHCDCPSVRQPPYTPYQLESRDSMAERMQGSQRW